MGQLHCICPLHCINMLVHVYSHFILWFPGWSYSWFSGVVLGAFYIFFSAGNLNMVFWFQPILAGCWPISAPGPVQSKRVRLETCCRMHPKPIPQTNYKQTDV